MTVRDLSPVTQRSYVHAVAKFGRFFDLSPDNIDLEDVRTYQFIRSPVGYHGRR
jgi:hypothetical protein